MFERLDIATDDNFFVMSRNKYRDVLSFHPHSAECLFPDLLTEDLNEKSDCAHESPEGGADAERYAKCRDRLHYIEFY